MNQVIDHLKEAQWLSRIQTGDDSAFTEVYQDYAPRIWKHVYYRTNNRESADDIMSETFLRTWEFVRVRSHEVEHLRAFIYRVANNLVVDHYRSRSRAAIQMDEEMERTLGYDAEIDIQAEERLQADNMRRALLQLQAEARDLLVMRFIDELTIEEIADALGKNRNAVYVSIHRAVKKLKEVCSTAISVN
jgi:RNA polymerase sigma-70 factor (ECF subfamily)